MTPDDTAELEPLEREFDPELLKELARYRGRWVATTRSRLLADGDSATEVYLAARESGIPVPIVFRVPEDGRTRYFF